MIELVLQDNFIGAWFLDDISICDKLIEYYESLPERHRDGGLGYKGIVDTDKKKCREIHLKHEEVLVSHYLSSLQKVCDEYIKKYPFCNANSPWKVVYSVKIQKYDPGDAYYVWHCERGGVRLPSGTRHLVFMTYLNDVTDAGETEFFHQKLKVRPQKGLTLIWPSDWTHTHRGVTSMTQTKYIMTGWFNYIDPESI
jgi:hypothetical protein